MSPSSGPLSGGTQVTITGSQLLGAQEVEFGGIPAPSFTYDPATGTITAVSPAGVAGTVAVTVVTPGGVDAVSRRTTISPILRAPAVSAVAPNSGAFEGGTTVTISGTNFSGATAVDFGGVPATGVTVVSSTQITATSPAGTGTVDVTVTTPDGTSTTSPADKFTYNDEPVVTGISPLTGPVGGGTTVTISGMNFTGATDVYFGAIDVPAGNFTVNAGGTSITLTSPSAPPAGTYDVTVVNPDGTSQISPADRFTYGDGPMVTGISPADGRGRGRHDGDHRRHELHRGHGRLFRQR